MDNLVDLELEIKSSEILTLLCSFFTLEKLNFSVQANISFYILSVVSEVQTCMPLYVLIQINDTVLSMKRI